MLIFVLGAARSGTTMMGRILGRHPAVLQFHELNFFEEMWVPDQENGRLTERQAVHLASRLMRYQYGTSSTMKPPSYYYAQASELLQCQAPALTPPAIFSAFLKEEVARQGKSIPCVHTPRNVHFVGEILDHFDEARVLWMVRDPRAVLCSQKRQWRRALYELEKPSLYEAVRMWSNYHPITYSFLWKSIVERSSEFREHPRVDIVMFEAMLERPEAMASEIFRWLDLNFSPDFLQVPIRGSSHLKKQPPGVGIDTAAANRWRENCLRDDELFLCQKIIGETMVQAGYEFEPKRPSPLLLASTVLSVIPKLALASLMNLRRTRNPWSSLKRRLGAVSEMVGRP